LDRRDTGVEERHLRARGRGRGDQIEHLQHGALRARRAGGALGAERFLEALQQHLRRTHTARARKQDREPLHRIGDRIERHHRHRPQPGGAQGREQRLVAGLSHRGSVGRGQHQRAGALHAGQVACQLDQRGGPAGVVVQARPRRNIVAVRHEHDRLGRRALLDDPQILHLDVAAVGARRAERRAVDVLAARLCQRPRDLVRRLPRSDRAGRAIRRSLGQPPRIGGGPRPVEAGRNGNRRRGPKRRTHADQEDHQGEQRWCDEGNAQHTPGVPAGSEHRLDAATLIVHRPADGSIGPCRHRLWS
jgi:hypothetical protein